MSRVFIRCCVTVSMRDMIIRRMNAIRISRESSLGILSIMSTMRAEDV